MDDIDEAVSVLEDARISFPGAEAVAFSLFEQRSGWGDSIDFKEITDYVVLLVYLLKRLGFSKTDCNRVIDDYRRALDRFKADAPQDVYDAIIGRKVPYELARLRDYVKGV